MASRSPRRLRLVVVVLVIVIPLGLLGSLVWFLGFGGLERSLEHGWSQHLDIAGRIEVGDARLAGVGALELADWRLEDDEGEAVASAAAIEVATLDDGARYRGVIADYRFEIRHEALPFWRELLADLDRLRKQLPSDITYDVVAAGGSVAILGHDLITDFAGRVHREPARGEARLEMRVAGEPVVLAASVTPPHAGPLVIDELVLTREALRATLAVFDVELPAAWWALVPEHIDCAGSAIDGDGAGGSEWRILLRPASGPWPIAQLQVSGASSKGSACTGSVTVQWNRPQLTDFTVDFRRLATGWHLDAGAGEVPLGALLAGAGLAPATRLAVPAVVEASGTSVQIDTAAAPRLDGALDLTWRQGACSAALDWGAERFRLADLSYRDQRFGALDGALDLALDGPGLALEWRRLSLAEAARSMLALVLPRLPLPALLEAFPGGSARMVGGRLAHLHLRGEEGGREIELAAHPEGGYAIAGRLDPALLIGDRCAPFVLETGMGALTGRWQAGVLSLTAEQEAGLRYATYPVLRADGLELAWRGAEFRAIGQGPGPAASWRLDSGPEGIRLTTPVALSALHAGWDGRMHLVAADQEALSLSLIEDLRLWSLVAGGSWQGEAAQVEATGVELGGRFTAGSLVLWPGAPALDLSGVATTGRLHMAPETEEPPALDADLVSPAGWRARLSLPSAADGTPDRLQILLTAPDGAGLAAATEWLDGDDLEDGPLLITYRLHGTAVAPEAAWRFGDPVELAPASQLDPEAADGDLLHRFDAGDDK